MSEWRNYCGEDWGALENVDAQRSDRSAYSSILYSILWLLGADDNFMLFATLVLEGNRENVQSLPVSDNTVSPVENR